MTEREIRLEHELAFALKKIEAMKPFLCGSLKCKNRINVKICPNCGEIVL